MNYKKSIVTNISWSLAEKVLTEIMNGIITIILARLIMPEEHGLISLVQIFVSITSIIVGNGLGSALIQSKDPTEEQVSTIFYLNLFIGLFIYIILFIFAPLILKIKNIPTLVPLLRVLAIKVPVSSIYSMQHSFVKKTLQFKKFFFSSLFGTLLAGGVGIIMAYKGFGVWALVFSTLIDQLVDCFVLLFSTKWLPKFYFSIKNTKKMIGFGFKVLFTEFISRSYGYIRSIAIGTKYSTADLAFSNKGQKITYMIYDFTVSCSANVLSPILSREQDSKNRMKEIVSNSLKVSSFFLSPIMIGIFITSDRFIPILLTEKWNLCVPYVKVYCLLYLFNSMISLDNKIIEANGEGNTLIKLQTTQAIIDICLIYFSLKFFSSPIYVVFSLLLTNIVTSIFSCNECKKLINYGYINHLKDYGLSLFISLIMGFFVFLVGKINLDIYVVLPIQIILGIFIYVSLSFIMNRKTFFYIIDIIKNKK